MRAGDTTELAVRLESSAAVLEDIVVTGTMKAVSRTNSPRTSRGVYGRLLPGEPYAKCV